MQQNYSLSQDKIILDFTHEYCDTAEKILNSKCFRRVLSSYIDKIQDKNSDSYVHIKKSFEDVSREKILDFLINTFKLLINFNKDEVIQLNPRYETLLEDQDFMFDFIEGLYGYWRKLERYSIIRTTKATNSGIGKTSFLKANSVFEELVLFLYRTVRENATGRDPRVYRQLPAGVNASIIIKNEEWPIPEEYAVLKNIPFVESVLLEQPVISYPKMNTRDGVFNEVNGNPLSDCEINPDNWFCFPAKVGTELAYIYFHKDFMIHGIALCNLFERAIPSEIKGVKPDIIYVYGAPSNSGELKTVFFDDKENDIMFGLVTHSEKVDYFGYMKKMTLTLHNLISIKKGYLPIHGAMVNIVMKDGKTANVVIMGDSGAGKSESLEAFRTLSQDYVSKMTIVFDDMGSLRLNKNGKPLAYGTETGAFVRLDDLAPGYAFEEIDRSIFMNPHKINSRLIVPVASYKDIIKGYPIDMFLYANNYDEVQEGHSEIDLFDDINSAMQVFVDGARMAKGTTTEKGLVKSFFANPFGPVQKQEETTKLIKSYFDSMYKSGVKVGQIKTSLGLAGKAQEGPKKAAIQLFEMIKNL